MTSRTAVRFTTACLWALAGAMPLAAASYELLPSQDARILGLPGYENANYKADILSVYTHGQNIQRTMMQFDLSGVALEPGQRLASATLTLSAGLGYGGSGGRPMEIYALSRPWTEDGLTWNRATASTPWSVPGGDFVGQGWATNGPPFAVSTATPAQNGEPVTWDVRELVDQWLEGLGPNHGLLLKSYEGNGLVFTQRESSSANLRPVLRIVTESGPPRLRIERDTATGDVVLSWRGVNTAVLQERAALASGPTWTDSALAVTSVGGRSVVTVPPEGATRFYRLRSK
jgi:hypothetical protein